MARRRFDDDEEERSGWFWRFLKGAFVSVIVCGIALAVLSVYVLPPPPEHPDEARKQEAADAGPKMIGGIEVSSEPAYTTQGAASGEATTPAKPAAEDPIGPIELAGPALDVNAAAFEVDAKTPVVAIVMDDVAHDPMIQDALFALGLPVTIGVVAGADGDRQTANRAYHAGYEVLAELPVAGPGQGDGKELEFGLDQQDAAARTEALMRRLPMAVAAGAPPSLPVPPDGTLRQGILSALVPHGFGYVDQASEAAQPDAQAMPGAKVAVSRFTIPAGAKASDIISVLDQAGAEAATIGSAIVYATPGEELFLALQLWGSDGTTSVAKLAPLSVVIKRQAGA